MGLIAGMVTGLAVGSPGLIRESVAQDDYLTLGRRPAWDWPSHDRRVDVLHLAGLLEFRGACYGAIRCRRPASRLDGTGRLPACGS